MEVQFTAEYVTGHIWRVRGLGDACMYYIKGSESGILVDTAYGVGDLRGFIESTFQQPYEVVITHGHADHANGMQQWSRVYMNTTDWPVYLQKTDIALRRSMLKRSVPNIDEYPDELFHGLYTGEIAELSEETLFHLGDVTVEPIHVPGHTQGIMALLIREDRVCIFGDACGVFTFLFKPESSTVSVYRDTLRKFKSYEPYYDRILRQHGTCESPKSLVDENLEVAEEILAGTDDRIPWEYQGQSVWIAKETDFATGIRKDGKSGNIVYSDDKIR